MLDDASLGASRPIAGVGASCHDERFVADEVGDWELGVLVGHSVAARRATTSEIAPWEVSR